MANDVKVTLSADDQATEVVRRLAAAVKQLSAENTKANKSVNDSAKGASAAASAFGKWQSAIAGVAAAFGAIKVLNFAGDALAAADQIGKLAQKSGASTEALSALAVAASTADLSTEDLANGLKFLSKSFTELENGSQEVTAAFEALGLNAKELKGLSLDQVLVRVANAQENFADGSGKTAALLKIFGRQGEELIPLLHDLANGGFDEAAKKAKALGLAFSGENAKAAQRFVDALTSIKNAAKGAVSNALLPLANTMASVVESFVSFAANHPDLAAFGAGAIVAASGAAVLAVGIGAVTVAVGALDVALAPVLGVIAALAVIGGIGAVIAKAFSDAKSEIKATGEAAKAAGQGGKPQVDLVDPAILKAQREARIQAAKQAAKDEQDIIQAGLKKQEQLNENAFAQGLVSIREFYAQRQLIAKQGVDAQIAELEREKSELNKTLNDKTLSNADRIKTTADVAQLEAQIKKLRIDGATQALALTEQERIAVKALQSELAGFAAEIDRARGDQIGAAQLEIEQTVQRFGEALRKINGLSTDTINNLSHQFEQLLTNRAAFDQSQRQSDLVLNGLALDRQRIQQEVNRGLISEREGELQLAALERSRIPALTQLADQMEFFANETENPELILAAKQLRVEIEGMGHVTDEAAQKMANLGANLAQATQADLSSFLGDTISHVNSLGEALQSLATSIVGSIQRVLADAISSQAIQALRGLFEGTKEVPAAAALTAAGATVNAGAVALGGSAVALSSAGATLLAAAAALGISAGAIQASVAEMAVISAFGQGGIGALLPFAHGGFVRGPGTGTSDSIAARLSAGEFVVRADAVRRVGVGFLEAINGARTPRIRTTVSSLPAFASGGLVSGGGNDASGSLEATIGLEDGLVLRHISSRGGVKTLLDVMGKNPNAFKAALGIG